MCSATAQTAGEEVVDVKAEAAGVQTLNWKHGGFRRCPFSQSLRSFLSRCIDDLKWITSVLKPDLSYVV